MSPPKAKTPSAGAAHSSEAPNAVAANLLWDGRIKKERQSAEEWERNWAFLCRSNSESPSQEQQQVEAGTGSGEGSSTTRAAGKTAGEGETDNPQLTGKQQMYMRKFGKLPQRPQGSGVASAEPVEVFHIGQQKLKRTPEERATAEFDEAERQQSRRV
eukprot:GHVU01189062.1.p3 GENE.GHVU01189062.1~~GHVU01189062.1.p3  ORF type:complete len:158 (-),score=35.95 GHVU01189062.1:671-1144(-)